MNERRYGVIALILLLIAFIFVTSPITSTVLITLNIIPKDGILHFLMFLGLIPGLVIAIIAFMMTRRMNDDRLRLTIRNISLLTIIGSLSFGILGILAMLLNHFAPASF